jgi:hypothetical protein
MTTPVRTSNSTRKASFIALELSATQVERKEEEQEAEGENEKEIGLGYNLHPEILTGSREGKKCKRKDEGRRREKKIK